MTRKIFWISVVFLTIAVVLSGYKLFSLRKQAIVPQQFQKASLQLKWIDQAQFAGFYMAKKQGLYSSERLDVEIHPGGPDISPIQMVISGVSDFGITGADQIIMAREKGVPIVALAVIYKDSPVAVGSLKEKNITSPKDLEGKRVGVVYGRDEETIYRALLKKEGVDSGKIVEMPVLAGISQITTDKFDAQILYEINEAVLLEKNGFSVNLIRPRDYGIKFYADTLFATEETIRNRPDVVRAFVRASVAGWKAAIANTEEAVKETLEVNKSLDKEHQLRFFQLSIPLINQGKIGRSEGNVWADMQEILLDQKLLPRQINMDQAFTNEFLE